MITLCFWGVDHKKKKDKYETSVAVLARAFFGVLVTLALGFALAQRHPELCLGLELVIVFTFVSALLK